MNFGADPVHRKGYQPYTHTRIKALHGLHQANAAFLHQIAHGQPIAGVTTRNMHNKAQVREHQLARSLDIIVLAKFDSELLFLLARQYRDTPHTLNVGIKGPDRAGQRPFTREGDQGSLIRHTPRPSLV